MKKAVLLVTLLLPFLATAQLPMLLNQGAAQLVGVPLDPALVAYVDDVTYFYGDSITLGYNPDPPYNNFTNRFSTLLSTQYSLIESNFGIGGSQIADVGESDLITANTGINNTNISVWLAGYNDMRFYGTNAAALADNTAALESLTAWLALPTASRVPWNYTNNFPNLGYIYYSPGWVFLPSALGGLAASTAAGNSASFNFSGNTLLIGTGRGGSGGNATVIVGDYVNNVFVPTVTNSYSCLRTSANTAQGRSYSAGLIVFTNLSNALVHGAIITAQSAGTIYFCWYAAYSTNQLPKVVLCGTLLMPEFSYQNPSLAPNTNGSDLAATQYSGIVSNVASVLAAAKLNVKWVPAPILNTNTDWADDYVHPNPNGHLKIKTAIQAGF